MEHGPEEGIRVVAEVRSAIEAAHDVVFSREGEIERMVSAEHEKPSETMDIEKLATWTRELTDIARQKEALNELYKEDIGTAEEASARIAAILSGPESQEK
jgi:hypothetical protein